MNTRNCSLIFAFLLSSTWSITSIAQVSPGKVQEFITDVKKQTITGLRYPHVIQEFYTRLNYKTAWIQQRDSVNRNIFFAILEQSADLGVNQKDYQYSFIDSYRNSAIHVKTADDSLATEIRITDAAIHFYRDIAYGNIKPALGYEGLDYTPSDTAIARILADHIVNNSLRLLVSQLSAILPEIAAIQNKIIWINDIISSNDFKETLITSTKINNSNYPLLEKLYQLEIIDSLNKKIPDSTLKKKVKEAQRHFNLLPDGMLRSTILGELNVPLKVRLQQLNLSINYYRWLYGLIKTQNVIVVNIPAAYTKVYSNKNVILEMRMIVGKKATPTPTLTSRVNEVILYPYWHVPYSIATKELLPSIKRDPGFIDRGNYQVVNNAGKIVDPFSINWHSLSAKYFPYIIRQSTGCDNALGLLKLNFYNPFGVYLHDTPSKSLFMLSKRYFSHGCMRMEKPMELGHLVLKDNKIAIDTLEQKGCLRNQSPITVHADDHMAVVVWYNPVGVDQTGRLLFYEDVYGKLAWMKNQ